MMSKDLFVRLNVWIDFMYYYFPFKNAEGG